MFHWYKIIMRLKYFLALPAGLLPIVNHAQAGQLAVNREQSQIEVAVSATIDSFVGDLEKYQADIDCAPGTKLPAKAKVSFDFQDLKTGNPSRDKEMLKWLDHSKDPDCTFTLADWKTVGTTNYADGTMVIHGVTRKIQMPVTIAHTGTNYDISGSADLNYHDFNLPTIRKMLFLTVDPHLHVTFHLVGTLPAN